MLLTIECLFGISTWTSTIKNYHFPSWVYIKQISEIVHLLVHDDPAVIFSVVGCDLGSCKVSAFHCSLLLLHRGLLSRLLSCLYRSIRILLLLLQTHFCQGCRYVVFIFDFLNWSLFCIWISIHRNWSKLIWRRLTLDLKLLDRSQTHLVTWRWCLGQRWILGHLKLRKDGDFCKLVLWIYVKFVWRNNHVWFGSGCAWKHRCWSEIG